VVQTWRDKNETWTYAILNQPHEISSPKSMTSQGRDVTGGIQPNLCISLQIQITMNQWKIKRWKKTLKYQCGWRDWGKLPMIIWICKGIGECVGWSTIVIFTSRESRVGSNKVYSRNTISWIYKFGGSQITFKGLCILWRRTCDHGLSYMSWIVLLCFFTLDMYC
jgi:hypothetical protein